MSRLKIIDPKSHIHTLRNQYNEYRSLILSNNDLAFFHKKYPPCDITKGQVCNICGMNDLERQIVFSWYESTINEMKELCK